MSGLIRKVILKNTKNVNVNGEMDKMSLQQRRRVNTIACTCCMMCDISYSIQVISTLKKVTLGEDLQSKPSPKPSPKSSPKSSPNLGKKSPGGRMSPLVEQKQMSVAPPRSPGLNRRSVSPQPPTSPSCHNKQPTRCCVHDIVCPFSELFLCLYQYIITINNYIVCIRYVYSLCV